LWPAEDERTGIFGPGAENEDERTGIFGLGAEKVTKWNQRPEKLAKGQA
jgi:hypothetical protein